MQKPSLVIFDMDGLMFDTENVYCIATADAAKRDRICVDMEVLYRAVGSNEFDMDAFFPGAVPDGFDREKWMSAIVEDAIDCICEEGVPKKPGLDKLLSVLKDSGIPCVVATSTELKRAQRLLHSAGVIDYFEAVVTAQDVACGKPAPDIFLEACRRTKVKPENALVLEDSMNGAKAALKAGIPCIVVPDLVAISEEVASCVVAVKESLVDVTELFQVVDEE